MTNRKYHCLQDKKKTERLNDSRVLLENPGNDPDTSRMLSGRSTI